MADESLSHVANVSSDIHMKASCQLRHTLKMLWDLPEQGQNIPKHGDSDRELPIKTQQSVNLYTLATQCKICTIIHWQHNARPAQLNIGNTM